MTTVAKSTNELLRGPGVLVIADQGTQPTEELGYHKEPLMFSAAHDSEEDMVQELIDPADSEITKRTITIGGAIAQMNVDALGRLMGITPDGGSLPLTGPAEKLRVALRVCSSDNQRKPIHVYLTNAVSNGSLEFAAKRGAAGPIAFTFKSLGGSGSQILFANAVQAVTLSTGSGARTQAAGAALKYVSWVKLTSETSTSDAVTDITGTTAALVNGEVLRLCAASGHTITVTHASGVIETKTAADFIMNSVADWIDLYYDLANTTWKEICRYDHDA